MSGNEGCIAGMKRKCEFHLESKNEDTEDEETVLEEYLTRRSDSPVSFKKVFEGLSAAEREKWTSPRQGSLARMRATLAQRYKGLKIYVDDVKNLPKKVWYEKKCLSNDSADPQLFLCGMFRDYIIADEIQRKWDELIANDKKICLGFILLAFKKLEDHMVYDAHKSSWHYNPDSVTSINAMQGQSRSTEMNSEDGTVSPKPTQEKEEKDSRTTTVMKALESHYFFDFDLFARLSAALESQMENSIGRDATAMLVRCACRIAFGVDFERSGIFIYQVGTSDYPFEGFPVSLKPNTHFSSAFQEGGSDGYIYPDLVVACENGDNVKFLLLIEVRSDERIYEEDICHMFCNTAGAIVGQSHVFALVMSHSNATLLKVSRHEAPSDRNSAIMCAKKDYMLLRHLVSRPFFNGAAWFELFTDILKVLDAAKQGIANVLQ